MEAAPDFLSMMCLFYVFVYDIFLLLNEFSFGVIMT